MSLSRTPHAKLKTAAATLIAVMAIGAGATACTGDEDKPQKVGSDRQDQSGSGGTSAGSGKGKDSSKGNGKDSGKKENAAEDKGPQTFKTGDRIALGDWQFVVHKVTDPLKPTNEFITPKSGNRWLAVDLEVKNKGTKTEPFSTILALELKDSQNKLYDVAITGEDSVKQPDGDVAAGESRRGTVVYEVPTAAKGFTLAFKPDMFGGSKATVDLGR